MKPRSISSFWVTLPVRNAGESVCWHTIVTYAKLAQHHAPPLASLPRPLIVVFCPYNCSFVRVIRTFCCCFMAALLCSPDPDPDPDPELTRPLLTPSHNLAHSGNILLVKFALCTGECVSVCVCGVCCSILWQLYKSTFTAYSIYYI